MFCFPSFILSVALYNYVNSLYVYFFVEFIVRYFETFIKCVNLNIKLFILKYYLTFCFLGIPDAIGMLILFSLFSVSAGTRP